MRRLILSDIHGNLEALEAVLRDAEGEWAEAVCLGDLVGYGASPAEVVAWARANTAVTVRGNHDRVCAGLDDALWFNAAARRAVEWTKAALGAEDSEWLRGLPAGPLRFERYEIAHGAPFDEDEYLVTDADVEDLDKVLQRPICFVGHTHMQRAWQWTGGGVYRLPAPDRKTREQLTRLEPETLYLINPGSVGQPRDRDPRAGYALWDDEERTLALRRVRYDVAGAQARIEEAGLPEWLAVRLGEGR
ncbi:MAG: metallophosphatase family protein [Bryobacteraceae bacterium]|nr:metallophosphoesterase family protein [Solibacteraceae bacterium]MCL4841339.1 metallophosphoesterase family protein [Bryobacteraceae bacterium]MCO5350726.1 metallophosphatase family protein [Bryobacteraceae bacterium]